ncbi:MAG: MBL fold metallo-hydrolase [Rhodobacteraceae bacterium]|nr:MBL fold metallo-hydrolase [Paracoccaceae bacterium]
MPDRPARPRPAPPAAAAAAAEGGGRLAYPWAEGPAEGRATEVAPGILWLRLPLPFRPGHVNAYALADDDGWTIVDPGLDRGRSRAVWEALRTGPLAGRPVARVLATHHHPDHIGLAGWLMATAGAALLTSRTAWLYARMLTLDVHTRPSPESMAFWQAAGMPADMRAARAAERPFNFADCVHPLPQGFTRLAAGDRLMLAGRTFEVAAGEGHAPEHLVLFSLDDGIVLGGDQLLPGISPNLGVYPTEPGADPVGEWLASARALAARARPDQLVLPGHRLPYRGLPARLGELVLHHTTALERLREHLALPRTAADCFLPLFGRLIEPEVWGLALGEAMGHLNHLMHQGEVTCARRGDGAILWCRAG